MAWFRPDLFSRVIAYSATLVAQQDPKAPESAMYPHGAWDYHSDLELIKNDTMGREKLLRIFHNANENDIGATAAASGRHNWLHGRNADGGGPQGQGLPLQVRRGTRSRALRRPGPIGDPGRRAGLGMARIPACRQLTCVAARGRAASAFNPMST